MKQAIAWFLVLAATAFAADDQLLQQALKEGVLARSEKVDIARFNNYSSRTQLKLNAKLPTVTFKAYTSTGREVAGTAAALDSAHLGAFTHGDIAHANRAALDLVSGTNTGDQTAVTGNAGTATALASNGGNCSAGHAALGVDASGAVEECFAVEPLLILLAVDASGGDQTVELTGASTMIVKSDDSANSVRIIPDVGKTLMGLTEYMLSGQYEAVVFRLISATYIKQ